MKKIYTVLVLAVIAFAFAMADNTFKVLRIYSEGSSTTIPLENIDSINHSQYDVDSVLYIDYITSVTWSIDSIYRFTIDSIDSVVIANVDLEKYKAQIESIQEQVSSLGEMDVQQFQTNLISWFESKDWVKKVSVNEDSSLITITFDNGLEFFVDYQDASFYDEIENNNARSYMKAVSNEQNIYDVSYQVGESTIESTDVLYIQAMEMLLDNSYDEHEKLKEALQNSPVDFADNLEPFTHTLQVFLNHDWSNYGLILISQTHGAGNYNGAFKAADANFYPNLPQGIFVIKSFKSVAYQFLTNELLYWVKPHVITRKIGNKKNVLYGNYCWSASCDYGLHGAFVGYKNPSGYKYNKNAMTKFVEEMTRGNTVKKAINNVEEMDFDKGSHDPQLSLSRNSKESKLRYFSISIDPITRRNNKGNPIITGKIHGYKNLKSWLPYYVYSHEGNDSFTPESSNVQSTRKGVSIDSEGNFTYEYGGDKYLNTIGYNETYGFMIGFEHDGKVYHGNIEYFTNNLCPDSNHPHMIDLGLPSGTKWSCCNVGAKKPGEYGGYYSWGNTEESDEYNWEHTKWRYGSSDYEVENAKYDPIIDDKTVLDPEDDAATANWGNAWRMPTSEECEELKENTTMMYFNADGVFGFKISGPNGNSIFVPSAGRKSGTYTWSEGQYGSGYYWSSSLSSKKARNAQYLKYLYLTQGIYSRDVDEIERSNGLSVRPVANQ